nr:uncharacterized protein CTRU02_13981 [Colletotrichum truncatum]KAF6782662.1 hypothetical protein CTRU02_13981 [Colletotrichum truncatum]
MRSSNSPFLYSLTILAVFAFSATAKSTPPTRPQSQIYSFALEERQPCPDNSTTSTCPTQTDITPCGDGTWCYLNYQCGTFLGRKGCCQDIFSGDKKIAPNKSCTAKLDVLGNMTWSPVTGNVSTIYPAFSFCTSTTLPAYQLMGSFSSSNETLAKGPKGEVCCPNVLDSVEYYCCDSWNTESCGTSSHTPARLRGPSLPDPRDRPRGNIPTF